MKQKLQALLCALLSVVLVIGFFYRPSDASHLIPSSRERLLGFVIGANFNSTADQTIPITSSKYIIRRITVTNPSTNLTLAIGGFYAAASKTTALVANTQVYTALTGSTKYLDTTLGALVGTDVRTETTLYFSLTTAQGGTATADLWVWGEDIS